MNKGCTKKVTILPPHYFCCASFLAESSQGSKQDQAGLVANALTDVLIFSIVQYNHMSFVLDVLLSHLFIGNFLCCMVSLWYHTIQYCDVWYDRKFHGTCPIVVPTILAKDSTSRSAGKSCVNSVLTNLITHNLLVSSQILTISSTMRTQLIIDQHLPLLAQHTHQNDVRPQEDDDPDHKLVHAYPR